MIEQLPRKVFSQSTESLVSDLAVDTKRGLSPEAVLKLREQYGENRLEKADQKPVWRIFFQQFLDPVIYVLIVAAGLGFAFGEVIEAVAVAIVILITAFIGFFMEWQAQRSMQALRKMAETHGVVIRDGEEKTVEAGELVPGDLLLLKTGDVVTADGRVIEHENLAVKEAALTGESEQVAKDTDPLPEDTQLAGRVNMVFKGTLVTRGTARVLVTATGQATELGRIQQLTQEAEKQATPIEKKLNVLSGRLIQLTIVLAVLIAVSGYLQGRDLRAMVETAIALAIAAIPEGLPIVATIALARGMLRLAKDRVIIKKLRAVETLGSMNIVCTDKTGTLTENEMSVRTLVFEDDQFDLPDDGDTRQYQAYREKAAFNTLIEIGVLCNNVKVSAGKEDRKGDPVEVALIDLAEAAGYDVRKIRKEQKEEAELPFDSETKMMATVDQFEDHYRINAKGALESLIEVCTTTFVNGEVKPLEDKQAWFDRGNELAARGLRTLAFAYRHVDQPPEKEHLLEELTFLGLAGFIDPPRNDVKAAIRTCHDAGIRVVMITGDHPETARNIAEAVGLTENEAVSGEVITGRQLASFVKSDSETEQKLLNANIFARVSPSQKLDLVTVYQEHGYVVGMTGDGVNDAPALKKADIGIAMGVRGTEAAKEVADVILRDDQFTSIELSIRQGRIIFENIRNFVVYLLSSNLAEIISVAAASVTSLPIPLLPLQILYLNLVTDVFPALALGMGEGEETIMDRPPRPTDEPIMPGKLWVTTVVYGLSITAAVLGITVFAHFYLAIGPQKVNNLAFYTLVLGQLLNVFNLPGRKVSFFINEVTRNLWVWGAIVLCILLTWLGYLLLADVLSLVPLTWAELGWVVVFSFASLLLTQIAKRSGLTV